MQHQDDTLKRIVAVLSGVEKATDEKQLRQEYELKNGRLFRKVGEGMKWVVPDAVRWRIMNRGHYGLEKTLETVQRDFWFRRMQK